MWDDDLYQPAYPDDDGLYEPSDKFEDFSEPADSFEDAEDPDPFLDLINSDDWPVEDPNVYGPDDLPEQEIEVEDLIPAHLIRSWDLD